MCWSWFQKKEKKKVVDEYHMKAVSGATGHAAAKNSQDSNTDSSVDTGSYCSEWTNLEVQEINLRIGVLREISKRSEQGSSEIETTEERENEERKHEEGGLVKKEELGKSEKAQEENLENNDANE